MEMGTGIRTETETATSRAGDFGGEIARNATGAARVGGGRMKPDYGNEHFAEVKRMDRMDCAQFQEVLHELDRPGTEGDALCERALAHAEYCSDCAALMTEVESLDFALRQVATESAELQAPPRLETLLLQEFRREKSATASRGVRWQLAAFAVAAAVLLALGLSLHRQHLVTPGDVNFAQSSTQAVQAPDYSAATRTAPDSNARASANTTAVQTA